MRSSAIACVALLILAALAGGACLPCCAAGMTVHGCCSGNSHCGTTGGNPVHRECAAPAADVYSLQVAASHSGYSLPALSETPGPFSAAPPAASNAPPRFAEAYSPPDLYLRNSVLTL